MKLRRWILALAVISTVSFAATAAADALKDDAIARLTAAHDPAIPIAIGRIYIKQLGLQTVRGLLIEAGQAAKLGSGWGPQAPEWQAAEAHLIARVDALIAREIQDPAWFRAAWADASARVLNAEEADEIAQHFSTEGGKQQRAVLELLLVGETLVANYTFTDRIHYGVKGSEAEMKNLQDVWWVNDHLKIYDFTPYPNAMRFASQDPGVKYSKMLAIQGIEAINLHFDAVARETTAALQAARSEIDPYIAQFRARTGGN